MSQMSINELLVEAFSAEKLADIDQNDSLPQLDEAAFIGLLDRDFFDPRASLLSQRFKLKEELKDKFSLSPRVINHCLFIDLMYELMEQRGFVHSLIFDLTLTLKPLLLKALLLDPQFIQYSKHSLRQLLDQLFYLAMSYDEGLSINGEQLLTRFREAFQSLNDIEFGNEFGNDTLPESIQKQLKALDSTFDHFNALEKRLCDTELRKVESERAPRKIDQFLDHHLANKKMPIAISQFLCCEWRNVIQTQLSKGEIDNKKWEHIAKLTQDLINTYSEPENDDVAKSRLAMIPTLRPAIEKQLSGLSKKGDLQKALRDIESVNLVILEKGELTFDPVPAILEENRTVVANISESVLKAASNLRPGQWLLSENKNGVMVRCKIALAIAETKEFLLVDCTGKKVAIKNVKSLGYELTIKKTIILKSEYLFTKILSKSLEAFIKRYEVVQKKKAEHLNEKKKENAKKQTLKKARAEADILRQQKTDLELKLKEEAEKLRLQNEELERRIKEESIKLEQKNRELEEKLQREAEALRLQNQELESKLKQEEEKKRINDIHQQVHSLSIGDWVSMKTRSDEIKECKIAVIYGSSGKIVFVDKIGIRVGEYTQEQLITMIIAKEAEIVKRENSFEQSMEQVIKSLKH